MNDESSILRAASHNYVCDRNFKCFWIFSEVPIEWYSVQNERHGPGAGANVRGTDDDEADLYPVLTNLLKLSYLSQ